ncbi:hypothetical protein FGI60_04855 [Brucella haematophila]|nr:hypothetical protein FGI60_04855 [Brucella haematophila]
MRHVHAGCGIDRSDWRLAYRITGRVMTGETEGNCHYFAQLSYVYVRTYNSNRLKTLVAK